MNTDLAPLIMGLEMEKCAHTCGTTYRLEISGYETVVANHARDRWTGVIIGLHPFAYLTDHRQWSYYKTSQEAADALARELLAQQKAKNKT